MNCTSIFSNECPQSLASGVRFLPFQFHSDFSTRSEKKISSNSRIEKWNNIYKQLERSDAIWRTLSHVSENQSIRCGPIKCKPLVSCFREVKFEPLPTPPLSTSISTATTQLSCRLLCELISSWGILSSTCWPDQLCAQRARSELFGMARFTLPRYETTESCNQDGLDRSFHGWQFGHWDWSNGWHWISQRAASSSSSADSPFRLNMAGTAATAVAIGSMAWYYHLYGSELYAMTPAEEGLVCYPGASTALDRCSAGRWNWGHRESRNEGHLQRLERTYHWLYSSLHATKYPWVHEQYLKTFDHQA